MPLQRSVPDTMSLLPDVPADLLGCTEPRLWTRPLRELTPATSYGFGVVAFARDVLRQPLDPWEEWAVIHGGELLPDGRPRFRTLLILVARQNGKTHLAKVLALWWLFVERWPLVLGTSTNLDYARESWDKAVEDAEGNEALAQLTPRNGVRRANGEQTLTTVDRCRYKIAASNRKGGRSLSIDRLICDELREHRDWSAWSAATPALNARPFGQIIAISNAGDDGSVVLNSLREAALAGTDPRLGILEWSAPEGADIMDPAGWAQANPNLGRRLDVDTVRGWALRAHESGGEQAASFRTEVLCQRVRALDGVVDPGKWSTSAHDGNLDAARARLALCLDVSPDGLHATLCAAGIIAPGITRVEVVARWDGIGCTDRLRLDLPGWVDRIKPRALGWFPAGPAAALTTDLGKKRQAGWPPRGVVVEEIRGEAAGVCMGFSDMVSAGRIQHPDDPLLNAHVLDAEKLRTGDSWRFSRRGGGHCDAAYAAAGAVFLANTLPAALSTKVIVSSRVAKELQSRTNT